jgi:hypothetical protein
MRLRHFALVFLATLIVTPTAQTNPTGTWKATFTGPIGDRPKPFGTVIFRFRVTDNHVTGTAIMGSWPGETPLTDAKFNGEHFSVTAIGTMGWSTHMPGEARVDHCCPKMLFDGTIHGDDMSLTMVWTSTEAPSDEALKKTKIPLVARKVSDDPNATIPE